MIYCQANFARGAGLGTRLFPWARAELFSSRYGCRVITPRWVQPRVGPLLRGGIDLSSYARQILLINQFKPADHYRRTWFKKFSSNYTEYEINYQNAEELVGDSFHHKVMFFGDRGRFELLNGCDLEVRKRLDNIAVDKWLRFAEKFAGVPIALNVRAGNDFVDPSTVDSQVREAVKTPLKWFVDTVNLVREILSYKAEVVLVSDGDSNYLEPILRLGNVHFVRPGSALGDLLVLRNADLLIRSGGSSFSAWAAFLGQATTLSPVGGAMDRFNLINRLGRYTGEFDPLKPASAAVSAIRSCLGGKK